MCLRTTFRTSWVETPGFTVSRTRRARFLVSLYSSVQDILDEGTVLVVRYRACGAVLNRHTFLQGRPHTPAYQLRLARDSA